MKFAVGLSAILLAAGFGYAAETGTFVASDLKWEVENPEYVRIDGNILTVDVPPEKANAIAYASAEIDLKNFSQCVFEFSVRCKAENLETVVQFGRGLKVALHYTDQITKKRRYPWALGWPDKGAFGWTNLTLNVPFGELAPAATPKPRLVLGIQQGYGRLQFDLSSVRVGKAPPIFPVKDNDYRVRYTGKIAKLGRMRGVMGRGVCRNTEQDIEDLRRYGANLIRLQMNGFRGSTLDEWNQWLENHLRHADLVLGWLEARDMYMALDMHQPPCGMSRVFYDQEAAERFVSAWREIARRYKGRKGIYGYDLMNEPGQVKKALPNCDYWNLQRRAAEAIRAVDPDAVLIVSPAEFGGPNGFVNFRALEMDNVVYQTHMYEPGWFTHQGANGAERPAPETLKCYPVPSEGVDIDYLRKTLKPVADFQRKHNARIYVGEFSACLYGPGAGQWISDCITVFEENNWDWTYHSFREALWWNVELKIDEQTGKPVPGKDNDRFRALIKGFNKGKSWRTEK